MVVTEMDDDVCYPTPSSPEVTRVVVEEGAEKEEENGITEGNIYKKLYFVFVSV